MLFLCYYLYVIRKVHKRCVAGCVYAPESEVRGLKITDVYDCGKLKFSV